MITFESIQDPYGLRAAGSILAQVLQNRALEQLQNQRQIQQEQRQNEFTLQRDVLQNELAAQRDLTKEARLMALRQKYGPVLGETLSVVNDPTVPANIKSQKLNDYLKLGGNIEDVSQAYKQLAEENATNSFLQKLGISGPAVNQSPIGAGGMTAPSSSVQNQPILAESQETITAQPSGIYQISDEALVAAAASPNRNIQNLAKAEQQRRQLTNTQFQAERKYQSERSTPYLKEIDNQRQALRNKEFALEEAQSALESGETGGFSINNISRIFGRPELLTQSGAQLLGSTKELLVSNIGRVGDRPNQWVEQQIASALPDLGKSPIANRTLLEAIRGEVSLARERIRLADDLAKEDEAKYGYVRGDIASRVDQAMQPFAEKVQRRAAMRMRDLYEQERGVGNLRKNVVKKVPEGTPLTPTNLKIFQEKYGTPEKAIENAKKLGYRIYTTAEYREAL